MLASIGPTKNTKNGLQPTSCLHFMRLLNQDSPIKSRYTSEYLNIYMSQQGVQTVEKKWIKGCYLWTTNLKGTNKNPLHKSLEALAWLEWSYKDIFKELSRKNGPSIWTKIQQHYPRTPRRDSQNLSRGPSQSYKISLRGQPERTHRISAENSADPFTAPWERSWQQNARHAICTHLHPGIRMQ